MQRPWPYETYLETMLFAGPHKLHTGHVLVARFHHQVDRQSEQRYKDRHRHRQAQTQTDTDTGRHRQNDRQSEQRETDSLKRETGHEAI